MDIDRSPEALHERARNGTEDVIDRHLLAMAGDIEWIEDETAPEGGAWAWTDPIT